MPTEYGPLAEVTRITISRSRDLLLRSQGGIRPSWPGSHRAIKTTKLLMSSSCGNESTSRVLSRSHRISAKHLVLAKPLPGRPFRGQRRLCVVFAEVNRKTPGKPLQAYRGFRDLESQNLCGSVGLCDPPLTGDDRELRFEAIPSEAISWLLSRAQIT